MQVIISLAELTTTQAVRTPIYQQLQDQQHVEETSPIFKRSLPPASILIASRT